MKGTFLFLGSGASMGVPVIGCKCTVCQSEVSSNKRLRPAGLLKVAGKSFLIDVGPDFREQALKYHIDHLDGLLLTHVHFDHIAGIDDLRIFYFLKKKAIPCLLSPETLEELKIRYHYLFRPIGEITTVSAQLEFQMLEEDFGDVEFEGVKMQNLTFFQSNMKVTGFRVGDFSYVTDIREYSDEVFVILKGVKKLVLSALRHRPSPVHLSIEEGIEFARKVGAEKTWFTHIAHDLDHEETNRALPPDIRLGADGLEIEFNYEEKA